MGSCCSSDLRPVILVRIVCLDGVVVSHKAGDDVAADQHEVLPDKASLKQSIESEGLLEAAHDILVYDDLDIEVKVDYGNLKRRRFQTMTTEPVTAVKGKAIFGDEAAATESESTGETMAMLTGGINSKQDLQLTVVNSKYNAAISEPLRIYHCWHSPGVAVSKHSLIEESAYSRDHSDDEDLLTGTVDGVSFENEDAFLTLPSAWNSWKRYENIRLQEHGEMTFEICFYDKKQKLAGVPARQLLLYDTD